MCVCVRTYIGQCSAWNLVGRGGGIREHRHLQSCVGVPRQDLAMPHLMRNCGKRILSLHSLYAIRTSVRACRTDHVSLRLVLVI